MTSQKQEGGDGSLNIQAVGNVCVGLTYSDVRKVALDIFEANFYRLSGLAAETARERAEELIGDFIEGLKTGNPEGVLAAQDPDFQYALIAAQCGYARSGNPNLEKVLVELLIERSQHRENEVTRVALGDAIQVAPKIDKGQLAVLGVLFLLRFTRDDEVIDLAHFREYLDTIASLVDALPRHALTTLHLASAGCLNNSAVSFGSIEEIMEARYPWLFSTGFPPSLLGGDVSDAMEVLQTSFHCKGNLQVKAEFWRSIRKVPIPGKKAGTETVDLQSIGAMSAKEIGSFLHGFHSTSKGLCEAWGRLRLGETQLTTVGIALGHTHCRQLGLFSDGLDGLLN